MTHSVPPQHTDRAFPFVLLISTLGTILSFGGVWLLALPIA